MSERKQNVSGSHLAGPLVRTVAAVIALMAAHEVLRQTAFPHITVWVSHAMTIVFVGLASTVAAYFALRRPTQAMLETEGSFGPCDAEGRVYAIEGVVTDIVKRGQAETLLRALLEITRRLNSTLDINQLLDSLVVEAMKLTNAQIGWSGLRTAAGMVCRKCFRGSQAVPFEYRWPAGVGWPGWVLTYKVPYFTNDAAGDSVIVPEIRERFGVQSGIHTPVVDVKGEVIAFFEVSSKKGDCDSMSWTCRS